MSASLATTLCGLSLSSCIYNASGPRTGSTDALSKIGASGAGAVLAKSATCDAQDGNPLPRTWQSPGASLNSEGLPNKGLGYYLAPDALAAANGKPYIVSLSGKNLADNLKMLEEACAVPGVSAIELNVACPNVVDHPIIGYDFAQLSDVLTAVSSSPAMKSSKGRKPLGLKLPPYFDGPHFESAARIINGFECVRYVAAINTVGNALVVDSASEAPAILPKGGFGGLSGPAVKYTALANVRKMRELLREGIDVVGVGGVETGEDAFNMILCGATAVQVGTTHWTEGPGCFERINNELKAIMDKKGYTTIQDFKGKLKPWSKEAQELSRAAKKAGGSKGKGGVEDGKASSSGGGGGGASVVIICFLLFVIVAQLLLMFRAETKGIAVSKALKLLLGKEL
jgi:dihydroorotate dehydrogenase (fumarate)